MTYLPGLEPPAPPADAHDGTGDEWYTPPEILDAVRELTSDGVIDLDPCYAPGCLTDARHRIDVRQGGDGLRDPWPGVGLVWCNPPYSDVGPWLERCRAASVDRVVVMLIPMRPETRAWWSHVWAARGYVVITQGRLRFVGCDGQRHGSGMLTTCFVTWSGLSATLLAESLRSRGINAAVIRKVS
jgi:hypothetical protein